MGASRLYSIFIYLLFCGLLAILPTKADAQNENHGVVDSLSEASKAKNAGTMNAEKMAVDSLPGLRTIQVADTIDETSLITVEDSLATAQPLPRNQQSKGKLSTWKPEANRALWLAIAVPGAGQIYNRKFWKLPVIYGGFVGCFYALRWNTQMYNDYSQAYMDIMDDDPNTQSYNQFMHLGNKITEDNMERYKDIFRKRKDLYRRWRDLSIFAIVAVYAISVIDAYVDASLSEFDISENLTLHIEPGIINRQDNSKNLLGNAIGINCSLTF